jgi:putative transposase
MSRFRLLPTPEQEQALLGHCRDARYVWNLAVEQQQHWQPGRKAPGYLEQAAQLTEARAEYAWLRAGNQTVQQQALRDFAQAMRNFFAGTHRRPRWRKAGVHEGFRQVGLKPHHVDQLNRRFGRVWVPKVGWVRFRLSRPVPAGVKSYRVTQDRAGRWHVAFAHVPDPICGPGDGSVVGIDRGVAVSAALSTGEMLHIPGLTPGESKRLKVLQQRLARAQRGSNRRAKTKRAIAKLNARERDRRKDWVEKITTDLARRFDVIRVEALDVRAMTRSARGTVEQPGAAVAQKRGLNRDQPKWLGPARRTLAAQGFRPGRAGPGCVHVATMLRMRARRTRKPQESSGLRVRILHCRRVQRRRQRCAQHRLRTGGDRTGRPRRWAVCEP